MVKLKYYYCYGCGAKSLKDVFPLNLCRVCRKYWTDCSSIKGKKRIIDKVHNDRKKLEFRLENT